MKMKKNLKKLFAVVMTLGIFCTSLAGCGQKKKSETVDISNMEAITENTMPITEEEITLTCWIQNRSQGYAKSYNDMEAFKNLAKKTGIKLEFIHPAGAASEQLSIMLASGELPDLIWYAWGIYPSLAQEQADNGAFLKLNEYIDKFAPNFKKLMAENESYQRQQALLGSDILYFPLLYDDERYLAFDGYFLRQDWLDKVGMDVPETMEEWEAVLTAFRDNDLNGNGKKDEVPFSTAATAAYTAHVFAGAYGLGSFGYFLSPDTGKVTHSVLEPGYKEYLTTMNRWYSEGLLNTNYISTGIPELDSMMLNDQLGAIYIDNNNDMPKYLQANPDLKLVAAPFPKAKNGKTYNPSNSSIITYGKNGVAISSGCKHPVEAVRFLDYLYTQEGSDYMFWGVEGESYTKDENGEYKFTDLILHNPEGKIPYEAICKYMTNIGFVGLHQYKAEVALENDLPEEIKKVKNDSVEYSIKTDKSLLIPYLPLTAEENEEIAGIAADLDTYMSEMTNKFLLGKESMDKYDEFVEKCKEMGIKRIIEIRQAAYDRAMK